MRSKSLGVALADEGQAQKKRVKGIDKLERLSTLPTSFLKANVVGSLKKRVKTFKSL